MGMFYMCDLDSSNKQDDEVEEIKFVDDPYYKKQKPDSEKKNKCGNLPRMPQCQKTQ